MFPNDDTPIPIPPPEVVRHRLTNTLRDARLLRDLLKLSERAEQERARREAEAQEVQRAS